MYLVSLAQRLTVPSFRAIQLCFPFAYALFLACSTSNVEGVVQVNGDCDTVYVSTNLSQNLNSSLSYLM